MHPAAHRRPAADPDQAPPTIPICRRWQTVCNARLLSASAVQCGSGAGPALNCAASGSSTRAHQQAAPFEFVRLHYLPRSPPLPDARARRSSDARRRQAQPEQTGERSNGPVQHTRGRFPLSTPNPRLSSGAAGEDPAGWHAVRRGRSACRARRCVLRRVRRRVPGSWREAHQRSRSCAGSATGRAGARGCAGRIRVLFSSSWAQARCAGAPQE